ncbi:MAG: UbiA family prenyltransferase [Pyrinomonadaceae bacterium]
MAVATQLEPNVPLCVDLDGTLIKSDILVESFFALLRKDPRYAYVAPFWLSKGKAYLKHQIAERVDIDVTSLPYHPSLLEHLKAERAKGRRIVLVTACNQGPGKRVAEHIGIFDEVLASDGKINLAGKAKLRTLVKKYGEKGFDYIGGAPIDLHIWPHANKAILVNPERGVEKAARRSSNVEQVFDDRKPGLKAYLKAIRAYQWLKNLLVFVPLVAAHKVADPTAVLQAVMAFIAFSLCASGCYILNDLLDLPADRSHPRKRHRVFAAGTVSLVSGALLIPVLLFGGIIAALSLPLIFLALLSAYVVLSFSYSVYLKKFAGVDVFVLAGLYTSRIVAGTVAIQEQHSFWLMAFSIFIFLSLALAKRIAELQLHVQDFSHAIQGRGYRVSDLEALYSMGTASGYVSVVVIALYVNSVDVMLAYAQPEWLWLICPLLLYWVSRLWLKTRRGDMHDDPLLYTIRDKQSRIVGVLAVLVCLLAI